MKLKVDCSLVLEQNIVKMIHFNFIIFWRSSRENPNIKSVELLVICFSGASLVKPNSHPATVFSNYRRH